MGDPVDQPGAPGPGRSARRGTGRRGRRRDDTRDPRRSRERALKILFQADIRGESPAVLLGRIVDDPRAWAMLDDLDPEGATELEPTVDAADAAADAEPHAAARAATRDALALDGFTRSLVQGVADHRAELDELIQRYARRWTVSRMPAIDRNLLRLGAYELGHEITSPAVVINEIIELAKRLSTEDSGRYVNGVLEAVRKHLAEERAERDGAPVPPVVEPVVPDVAAAPPFEPVPEPLDTLPAPDDDGDAVDLVEAAPDADEADEPDQADVDEVPPSDDDGGLPGQQQLF